MNDERDPQEIPDKREYGEPWFAWNGGVYLGGAVIRSPGRMTMADDCMTIVSADMDLEDSDYDEHALMRRIAACVNACSGIPTEELERNSIMNPVEHDRND